MGEPIGCDNNGIHDVDAPATELVTWTCMAWGDEASRTAQAFLCTPCANLFAPLMAYGSPSPVVT